MKTSVTNQPPAAGEAAHTPTPWVAIVPPSSCFTTRFIEGPNGEHIAKIGHMDYSSGDVFSDVANAAFIVRACNSHAALVEIEGRADELLAALAFVTKAFHADQAMFGDILDSMDNLRAALAAAKEGKP